MFRFSLITVLLCVVLHCALAQNRGSSRYVPEGSDDYDGERTIRPATRRTSARRGRPAPAVEPAVTYDEPQLYQQSPSQQAVPSARRLSNNAPDQHIPPSLSETTDHIPSLPHTPEEPHIPDSPPENKQQGRRRKQKKRKRPQNTAIKPDVDSISPESRVPENKNKEHIHDLHHKDEKRIPSLYQSPGTVEPNKNTHLDSDRASWSGNTDNLDAEAPSYFPPQSGTNRLPVGDIPPSDNSRRYPESSPIHPNREIPMGYSLPEPDINDPAQRGSYVPILVPNRGSSQQTRSSFNPHKEEKIKENKVPPTRQRTPGNRSPSPPLPNPDEYIRSTGAKPSDNVILGSNEPGVPVPSHGEVRLPLTEQPLIAPEYDRVLEPEKLNERNPHSYLEPSGGRYDSASVSSHRRQENVPHISRNAVSGFPEEREASKHIHNSPNSDEERKLSVYQPPLQRSVSRYRPEGSEVPTRSRIPNPTPDSSEEHHPRSRGPSRYQPENVEHEPSRTRGSPSRVQADTFEPSYPNVRSSSRSQADNSESQYPNTRSSSRSQADNSETRYQNPRSPSRSQAENSESQHPNIRSSSRSQSDSPRSRSPSRSPPPNTEHDRSRTHSHPETVLSDTPRTRGSSRYQPETREPTRPQNSNSVTERPSRSRSSSTSRNTSPENVRGHPTETDSNIRKSPINPESHIDAEYSSGDRVYRQRVPIETEPPQRHSHRNSYRDTESVPEEPKQVPSRNSLRSRPQYESRQPEHPYLNEEPADDRDTYVHEYQEPNPRNQRVSPNREQPEYPVIRSRNPPREEADYRAPPQRQQTNYQAPQNPRVDRNQATRRQPTPPQQPRSRPQDPAPKPTHERSSGGGSRFKCPDSYGFYADPVQCDKYYECRNGTAFENLCEDGLAFNEVSAPKYLRCDSLRDVDCNARPELQEARPTKNCPRRFGLFPHETDCTKFWNCVDGVATEVQCPPGLTFNDDRATCDWADLVKTSCKTEELLGFTCPEATAFDLQDGVYSTYPHPDNCQLHFACIKGEDGLRRPRLLSCNEGLVFDPQTSACKRPEDVPGCENFYGNRSPAPKRKPSRDPYPAEPEEVIEEEPKPTPRRRNQNRRVRY